MLIAAPERNLMREPGADAIDSQISESHDIVRTRLNHDRIGARHQNRRDLATAAVEGDRLGNSDRSEAAGVECIDLASRGGLRIAPGKVLHGAVRLHGLASSPTPETQVRLDWAFAVVLPIVKRTTIIGPSIGEVVLIISSSSSSESTRVIILPSRGSKLAHSWMELRPDRRR